MKHLKSLLRIALISLVLVGAAASFTSCNKSARTLLLEMSNDLNANCPLQYDTDVLLTHTTVDRFNFVYIYSTNEEYVLQARSAEGKENILDALYSTARYDRDLRYMLEICYEAGLGIEYRYTDNYGNSSSIIIDPHEIGEILKY